MNAAKRLTERFRGHLNKEVADSKLLKLFLDDALVSVEEFDPGRDRSKIRSIVGAEE
jgi:hypothetical protein